VDPEALKLSEEIESSRKEIEKLQERVRQLVARRGKRAELVKSSAIIPAPEIPSPASNAIRAEQEELGKELTIEEGFKALQSICMSDVRLIAFKHGAIVLLLANERSLAIRMDERGPKPLLDLLTANESKSATSLPSTKSPDKRNHA